MIKKGLYGLYELQEIEGKFEILEQAIRDHPTLKYLNELKENIKVLEKTLQGKNERIISLKIALRQLEQKITGFHSIAKQYEEKIYGGEITTIKELNILKDKQDLAQSNADKYEEKALEIMEKLENLRMALPKEAELANKKKKEYNRKQLKTRKEIDKMKDELTEITKQKQRLEASISPELLDKYYRIRRFKHDPVALVLDGKCTGCMVDVSVMIALDVKRHEGMIFCENCGRILV